MLSVTYMRGTTRRLTLDRLRELPRAWRNWQLQTKGLVVIALPIVILFAALLGVGWATHDEEAAADQVRLTLQIQGDLQTLEALIYRAIMESALAGTHVMSMPRLNEAEAELPRTLDALNREIQGSEQGARLLSLDPVAREMVRLLRTQRSVRPQTSESGPLTSNGYAMTLGHFTFELDGLRRRQAVLLKSHIDRATRARTLNLLITWGAGVVGVIGSLAAVLLFSGGVVRRVSFLEANARRLALGEQLIASQGGADEIGRLENALNQASALLSHRQSRLEYLVARLFHAQEEERRRVAYELHDGLAQVAAAAHRHLQTFAERYPPETLDARTELECGLSLVQRSVWEARAAIAGLRPTALDDFGLLVAVKNETEALRALGHEVTFSDTVGKKRFLPTVETALFRIAQELLLNIRKHAGPNAQVRIALEMLDHRLRLSVQDDGLGFDLAPEKKPEGIPGERMGLESVRERAALVGGSVRIESALGAGTLVQVDLPISIDAAIGSQLILRK